MTNKPELILKGNINSKKLDRVRNKKSQHLGNEYFRLKVSIENRPEIKEILVFENWLESKDIYQSLENWKDYNQKYLFTCQRKPGAGQVYRLINWEKLESHGNRTN